MKIYVSQPRGYPTNLPRQLEHIAALHQVGYLTEQTVCFVNTNLADPLLWVWTEQHGASCLYWYPAPTAGTVRLTADRIRWAPAYRTSGTDPMLDITPSALLHQHNTQSGDARMTLVVDHLYLAHGDPGVGIADGHQSRRPDRGHYDSPNSSVLDLPHYQPRHEPLSEAQQKYHSSLAFYHGTAMLTRGMSAEHRRAVLDDLEAYAYPVTADFLDLIAGARTMLAEAARTLITPP